MSEFKIGHRLIGDNHPPVVIVEIGINHEGSIETAIAMTDKAIDSGAEIIKHQTHIIEDEMSNEAKLVIPGDADVSIYEIMRRCALSEVDERHLMEHVQQRGAIFISSANSCFPPAIALFSSIKAEASSSERGALYMTNVACDL